MNRPVIISACQKARYLFGVEFAEEVLPHAQHHQKSLDQLEAATIAGNRRRANREQDRIFKSYSSRLTCLVRSLKKEDDVSPEWVREAAAQLNAWEDPGEPVVAWAEPKASGDGWRPMCKFGPKRRALQTLVGDVIITKCELDPTNFLRKGGGADRASLQIKALIEAGYEHFNLIDIKDYYRSVQHQEIIKALQLPKGVYENCVLIGPKAHIHALDLYAHIDPLAFEEAVRQGLPQGSRVANIIAGLLLGPVLRSLTSADRIVVHGDDAAIAACSMTEAKAFHIALPEIFKSHPAGPFCLKRCEVGNVWEGFNFLKYKHRRDSITHEVRFRPATKSYAKFKNRVISIAQQEGPATAEAKVELYSKNWSDSFLLWNRNEISDILLWCTAFEATKEGLKAKK
jgi:hypothetical protein